MVGLGSVRRFAQSAMERTEPFKNMTDGAFQDLGMAVAEKTGFKDAVSDLVAKPINMATSLFRKSEAPKAATTMEKALNAIKKPSFIAGTALSLGALYAVGRMTSES